jgi:hypothetical protein
MAHYHAARQVAGTVVLWLEVSQLWHHLIETWPRVVVTAALLLP